MIIKKNNSFDDEDDPYEDPEPPETLEELIDSIDKYPGNMEMLQLCFIDEAETIKDNYEKAKYLLELAEMCLNKIPLGTVLDLTRKAIKAYPRIPDGMPFFINLCAADYFIKQEEDSSFESRFGDAHSFIVLTIMRLCNYSEEKIKAILLNIYSPSREDEQIIEDFNKICAAVDNLHFTWDIKKDKKELYDLLCTRIEPNVAAILTITLSEKIPPPYIRAFYAAKGVELAKNEEDKDDNFAKSFDYPDNRITELLDENEELKKQIKALTEENEHQRNLINSEIKSLFKSEE